MLKKDQLGIYEKSMPGFLSLEEKLKLAGEAGYDFLEISIDETEEKLQRLEYGEAERRDIRAAMDAGADGVGLLRSEFVITGDHIPGEDEQYYYYMTCLEAAAGVFTVKRIR